VRDLSPESAVLETELVAAPSTGLATVERPAQGQRAVAILGSVERRGHWTVARSSEALAVLGSVVIDLRDVTLPPGVTTILVSAVLGSIEILVPPNIAVESEGSGILGSFEGIQRVPRDPDPELPVLRVQGRAVLGSIEVVTRPTTRVWRVARCAANPPQVSVPPRLRAPAAKRSSSGVLERANARPGLVVDVKVQQIPGELGRKVIPDPLRVVQIACSCSPSALVTM